MKKSTPYRTLGGYLLGGVLLFAFFYLIYNESRTKRPEKLFITSSGNVEMCLSCHEDVALDAAHDANVIGCSVCHLGDPLAVTEKEGHKGMVINPGDLRVAEKSCSVEGCHPTDLHKVKNSLMATNRGILGTLLYYWGETDSQDTDLTVEELLESGESSLALDYYRKLCATCHLWKQKNDLPGLPEFFNDKGGGCTACHFATPGSHSNEFVLVADDDEFEEEEGDEKKKPHPLITKKVGSSNCVRCHNRSGRIGISYMGIFESEGYGTPFENGSVNDKQLPGRRFYLEIADDIHHAKGMECIDCHTRNEIMGDGTSYAHYEDQLEITCKSCHDSNPGKTRKGDDLTNVESEGDEHFLFGKVEEKRHTLKPPKQGVCIFPGHKRVTCEACHSTWVAQCYGCHVKRDASGKHLDKLALKETEGLWEEGRSYIRYERPMLGVWEDEIVVVTPGCQDIVTLVNDEGEVEEAFDRFTMAAINPHTTQAKGRECLDCHASTKTVGLGEGRIKQVDGKLVFESTEKGIVTAVGQTVPLDAYVGLDGVAKQHSSRPELRPFNGDELRSILRLGLCVGCHDSYADPIWKDYNVNTLCKRPGQSEADRILN
ncbi:hypothetical protein [Desulforhopalus sp. 52FAK]